MLRRNYTYTVVAQVAQAILGLMSLVVLARTLGPVDFGTLVLLSTVLAILVVATSSGPQAAVLVLAARDATGRPHLHGQILAVSVLLIVPVALITVYGSAALARLITGNLEAVLLAITLVRLPVHFYAGLVSTAIGGMGRVGTAASLMLVAATANLLSPILALALPNHLEGAVFGAFLGSLFWGLSTAFVGQRALGIAWPHQVWQWRSLIRVAVPSHIGTLAYWLMLRADAFVVNAVIGGAAVGVYGLALSLSERVAVLSTPIYTATAWLVSGADGKVALKTMLKVTRLELCLAAVLTVLTLFLAPLGLTVIGGSAYAGAALPLTVLIFGAAILPVWSAVGLYLISQQGAAWLTAKLQVIVSIAAVVGYWIVVPFAGITGAAVVSTGAYLAMAIVGFAATRRRVRFPLQAIAPDVPELIRLIRGQPDPAEPETAPSPT